MTSVLADQRQGAIFDLSTCSRPSLSVSECGTSKTVERCEILGAESKMEYEYAAVCQKE